MYLSAEALLFAFRSRPAASVDIYDITRMIRLGVLLILLSIVAISRAIPARPRCMDEEDVPLLQDACNRPQYGSTACNEDLDSRSQNNQSVLEYTIPRVKVYTVQLENILRKKLTASQASCPSRVAHESAVYAIFWDLVLPGLGPHHDRAWSVADRTDY